MTRRTQPVVLDRLLDRHPAYVSWQSAVESGQPPTSIEVLKPEKPKSAVYRLNGVGHGSLSVIAKRSPKGALAEEVRLYRELLPSVALTRLEIYGFVEEYDGFGWLFLEDAGDIWYSPRSHEHQALAVEWLGHLHAGASTGASWLPDTGVQYFRSILDLAQSGVRQALGHAALSPSDRGTLDQILRSFSGIEQAWHLVEEACRPMPSTLVHGDFVPKNVRVRRRGRRSELVAFDWETAGVAPPAVDIAMVRASDEHRRRYLAILHDVWPRVRQRDVARLEDVGTLFRLLHEIYWENRSFAYSWVERAMRKMTAYELALRAAVVAGGWVRR